MLCEAIEQAADPAPGGFDGAFFCLAKQGFELGEDPLDWIEVWAVGRQEKQLCPDGSDGAANCRPLVGAEVVHDHDVARFEGGAEELLDVGKEACRVARIRANNHSASPARTARRTPPIGLAPALPVARNRCDHFTTLDTLTPNNAAV